MEMVVDRPVTGLPHEPIASRSIGRLAFVMIVLGLCRFVPRFVEWVVQVRTWLRFGFPPVRTWSHLLRDPHLANAAWQGWPLAIAVGLLVLRWPSLLGGAAISFLIVAGDELASVGLRLGWGVGVAALGSAPQPWSDVLPIVQRAGFAAFCTLAAWWAWRLRRNARASSLDRREPASRPPAMAGRMAVVGALVFLGVASYYQLWKFYEQVVLRDPRIRVWMAAHGSNSKGRQLPESPRQRLARRANETLNAAMARMGRGEYADARRGYIRAIRTFEQLARSDPRGRSYAFGRSLACNNLAWMLATCEDCRLRDPEESVALARRALDLVPNDGNTWNTLAVALFRAGWFAEAESAFDRSMKLRVGGDSYDWFFLALLCKAQSRDEDADRWYHRAIDWRAQYRPLDRELYRFHVEAAKALGKPLPERPRRPASGLREPIPILPRKPGRG